jgi:hypothetical protein
MTCGVCDGAILRCGMCRSEGCPTPVCTRCAYAQPEAHILEVPDLAPLGPRESLLDW